MHRPPSLNLTGCCTNIDRSRYLPTGPQHLSTLSHCLHRPRQCRFDVALPAAPTAKNPGVIYQDRLVTNAKQQQRRTPPLRSTLVRSLRTCCAARIVARMPSSLVSSAGVLPLRSNTSGLAPCSCRNHSFNNKYLIRLVCPEPVLAKDLVFGMNGARRAFPHQQDRHRAWLELEGCEVHRVLQLVVGYARVRAAREQRRQAVVVAAARCTGDCGGAEEPFRVERGLDARGREQHFHRCEAASISSPAEQTPVFSTARMHADPELISTKQRFV